MFSKIIAIMKVKRSPAHKREGPRRRAKRTCDTIERMRMNKERTT